MSQVTTATVTFEVVYPQRLSRLHLLIKTFLGWLYVGIPHGFILYIYGILAGLVEFIAFLVILLSGRYPRGLFNFVVGYHRWNARVGAYLLFLVDAYPPFSTEAPYSPVGLEVSYPEQVSRLPALLKFFLGWLYAGIPHVIALFFYGIAVLVVLFISWWAILILGRFPRPFFNFVVGFSRWVNRLQVYLAFLRDEYPPFHGRA
jgi:hypothetical protein